MRLSLCFMIVFCLLGLSGASPSFSADASPAIISVGGPWEWSITSDERKAAEMLHAKVCRAIFLLRSENTGIQGTAFCIDTKHRLLATTAHTLEKETPKNIVATQEGTGNTFRVARWWSHSQATESKFGTAFLKDHGYLNKAYKPDVAILQLEEGSSLELDLPVAPSNDVFKTRGRAIVTIGYPWYVRVHGGTKVASSANSGLVAGYLPDGEFEGPQSQLLCTSASSFGMSGAPALTLDGTVVGINMTNYFEYVTKDSYRSITSVCGAHHLWEVCREHKELGNLFPETHAKPIPSGGALLRSAQGPLPTDVELIVEHARSRMKEKPEETIYTCTALIVQYPYRPELHSLRAEAYLRSAGLNPAKRDALTMSALQDAIQAYSLDATNPARLVNLMMTYTEVTRGNAFATSNLQGVCETLLSTPKLHPKLIEFTQFTHGLLAGGVPVAVK